MKQPISPDSRPSLSQTIAKFLLVLGLTLLLMVLWAAPVALAKVQFLKEADQWVYQSQQILPDTDGELWQVTVLKPMEQGSQGVYLWLTTETKNVQLDAAKPLILETKSGETLQAPNLTQQYFMGELPAANVGQYDIQMLLPDLTDVYSLELKLPTKTADAVHLLISNDVLAEWLNVGTCQGLICSYLGN